MEWKRGALCALALCGAVEAQAAWIGPFISELHYDNAGTDVGEFVAVTAPSGTSLDGWSLVLYNGTNGSAYRTLALDGTVDGGLAGWGEMYWPMAGLQNGPDGVALVAADETLVDMVAYGGLFDLVEGPAAGAAARLLPLVEDSATPVGRSLQRIGQASEWAWIASPASPGTLNPGLQFAPAGRVPAVGLPLLLLAGGLGWALSRRASAWPSDPATG
jgi:5'-nucleotidase